MPKITIADVAKEAGVSTMTVSRVLNRKGEISQSTRDRVQREIDRLGYRPSAVARGLATRRTQTIGLVIPDITNPFFPEIVRGAEDTAWQAGYTIVLCNTVEDHQREAAALERLEDNRVDGVVLCSARLADEALLPLIKRHGAAVLINRSAPSGVAGTLEIDDAHGAMRAVHHLLARGHGTIGLLAGPSDSYSGKRRLQGYTNALETTGGRIDPALIKACTPDEGGGTEAAKRLLERRPDLSALVCYNDLVAIGTLQACAELGVHVPGDLAVIGCDDIRLASLVSPSLTTLRVDKYDLGVQAVRMLLGRMEEGAAPHERLIKPELVVRASAP
ncbi:MAG: LacI family transcriptional regulator [Deinococcota bacterium]|nr:LacI family transcriptional regulator [Deinococcota bacterium]